MSVAQMIGIGVAVAIVALAVWVFNRMVSLRVRAGNAWSDIDVQLKRRADLVPSLVQTVRGYAAHEHSTLEQTIASRSAGTAGRSQNPAERAEQESQVNQQITRIVALAEAYPDLKADELFGSLHHSLVEIEDNIQSARRYYNAVTRDYNTILRQFPQSLVAGLTGMQPREFFELERASDAAVPTVDLKEGR